MIALAIGSIGRHAHPMAACTQNVKKRKARRIKNDRLQAAKRAAQAKVK
jgi:hypothetical protein